MNDDAVVSIAQIQELIKLSNSANFIRNNQTEAYQWINHTLGKFRYFRASKKNRTVIKTYIRSMTGYSDPQVDRLIARKKLTGTIRKRERVNGGVNGDRDNISNKSVFQLKFFGLPDIWTI